MSSKFKTTIGQIAAFTAALGTTWTVFAQDQVVMEEIVVTGSLIRGTPEDSAMPVDTISSDELDKQGAPPPLEMLKGLSYMNGIVGEANQFTSGRGQAAMGSASINMRGLGANRTLVLLNGKRLASEDANRLPQNAIARVEVLKDGGAVTYGSDAIGGVVNYITKEGVEGFEFSTDYRAIEDSDGDYNIGLSWGMTTDNSDFFTSLNYYHRSDLAIVDRDWARTPYSVNPQGGWTTGANPGNTTSFIDPGCEAVGGVLGSDGRCNTRYTDWDNLVEEQDSYQFFASYNLSIGDNTDLHLEALYADTDVPHSNSTPTYTFANLVPSQLIGAPAGSVNPFLVVPASNPAVQDMIARGVHTGGSVILPLYGWRPFFSGGNPGFGYEGAAPQYERDQLRLSAELTGSITDNIGYTTSLSYGESEDIRNEWDIRIDRMQLALVGLGGPDCTGTTPGAGGCEYFNPFSTAYPSAPMLGLANPFFDPALENSAAMANWLQAKHVATTTTEVVEFNFVLDGELGVDLGGGNIGWAAGVQYRHDTDTADYNEQSNRELNPCPMFGDTSCVGDPTLENRSPWLFLGTYSPYDLDREVKAIFGEMILPITDNLTAQIAARFEDYGDIGGSSFDPNIRLRWQATDWLAFRGSVGTTFRVADQTSLDPASGTAFTLVGTAVKPVETSGNPGLDPEESTNLNLGVLFSGDNFDFSIDYWRFDIDKVLTAEPISGILAGANSCVPAFLDRVEYSGTCGTAGFTVDKITRTTVNGASILNDGVDLQGRYTWDEIGPGSLSLGGSATWINKFETDTLVLDGVVFEEGFDGVGKFNRNTTLFPLPEWRGNVFLDYAMDTQNIRWTMQYVDSYEDETAGYFVTNTAGQTIDSWVTHNITYRLDIGENITLSAALDNVTDEDPPFARTEINYDAVTHTPLGRTFKVGAKVRF